jgi:3-oxoacyl-[acyl-carrier-protein] synthase II
MHDAMRRPVARERSFQARKPRVVITGVGVVAPNGTGKEAFWHGLRTGHSGIDRISFFDASQYPCQIAGEVRHFDATLHMESRDARRTPRVAQLAVAAARMACQDARLDLIPASAQSVGVCFGTSSGKPEVPEVDHTAFLQRGVRGIHPLTLVEFPPHAVSSHVAIALQTSGLCGTLSTGCTTGLDVVQWGYEQICHGRVRAMVVGSSEALITPFAFGLACAAGVVSKRNDVPQQASRPFELHRDGLVVGEGAGALVLEEWHAAQERQAPLYAEVLGYASGQDGQQLLGIDASGAHMARIFQAALRQAGVSQQAIDHVNAHGIGLSHYDTAETNAIKTSFGRHAYNLTVSSIKSMIGHAFAAAGILQVVASCLTLQHGVIPPTINYDTPDPSCDLDYVANQARRSRVHTVLVHAHGMGGTDAALVLRAAPHNQVPESTVAP